MNPDQEFVSTEIKTPANATAYYEFERVKAPATLMPIRTAPASLTHVTGSAPIGPPDAEPLALFTGTPIEPVVKSLDVNPDTDSKKAPSSLKTESGRDKRDMGQAMMFYPVKKLDTGMRVREERLPDKLTGAASHDTADPPTTASMFDPVFTGEDTKSNMRMIVSSLGPNGFVNTAVHSRITLHVADLLASGTGVPTEMAQGLATTIVDELVICHTKPHQGKINKKQGAFLQITNPLSKIMKQTFVESDLFNGEQKNLTLLKITLLSSCYGAKSEEDHMNRAFTEYIRLAQLMLENRLSYSLNINDVVTLQADIRDGNVVSVFESAYAMLESVGITSSMTHFFAGVQWMHMLSSGMSPQDVALYSMGTVRVLREMKHLQTVPAHVIDLATLSECAITSVDTFRKGVTLITNRPGVPFFNEDMLIQISHLWSDMSNSEFKALLYAGMPPEAGYPGLIAMSGDLIKKHYPPQTSGNYTPLALGLYQQMRNPMQVNTSLTGFMGTLLKANEIQVLTGLVLVAAGVRLFQISYGLRSMAQRALQTRDYSLDIVGRMKQLLNVIRNFNSASDDLSDKVLMEAELVWRPSSETMFFHKDSGLFKEKQFEPTEEDVMDEKAINIIQKSEEKKSVLESKTTGSQTNGAAGGEDEARSMVLARARAQALAQAQASQNAAAAVGEGGTEAIEEKPQELDLTSSEVAAVATPLRASETQEYPSPPERAVSPVGAPSPNISPNPKQQQRLLAAAAAAEKEEEEEEEGEEEEEEEEREAVKYKSPSKKRRIEEKKIKKEEQYTFIRKEISDDINKFERVLKAVDPNQDAQFVLKRINDGDVNAALLRKLVNMYERMRLLEFDMQQK